MSVVDAISLEREGRIEQASTLYEEALASGERTLQVFLNLAILYWQSTDPGLSSARGLSPRFVAKAGARIPTLLSDARSEFPHSAEVEFWRRYIAWADLGEPFSTDECRKLLHEAPSTLVPAMYLFSLSQGRECHQEALELLETCRADGSTRARYVCSVIESELKRSKWAQKHGPGMN
ncbi:hypothetical protein JY651_25800 [Pyxidicoccus parkwayensis]|uniref:Uncharacterized protein n=1 Tax=Pyxidicoccus parkwayensis TaxID=2813578 RepID=A0ABX7NIV9_9BACT|nr:hypothetical protein [Pyxidicoccus parkwaysis]QSQ18776.1 hypothetical protein JY651_25800 [Pyxidicoccus parkwaysis]